MGKTLLIIFGLLVSLTIYSQIPEKSSLDRWDSNTLAKANTGVSVDYLNDEEKMVIFITNLARINGPLFIETILEPYLQEKPKTRFTKSLYKDLNKVNNLKPLQPESDLYKIALGHAEKTGRKGTLGHEGFERRFKPLMTKYNMVAENCAYGFEKGFDNALQLLIDEGVQGLGHRKNMLNPEFNSIGVSIKTHKTYRYTCVMDFGKKSR